MAEKRALPAVIDVEVGTALPTSPFDNDLFATKLHHSSSPTHTASQLSDTNQEEQNFDYGEPIHIERHIRVIVVGAGPSGLLLAYKLQRSFTNFSLTLYDKNPEISGTWFENRYPGCACDIPAHNYTYTFEPKHDWSTVYAGSDEIRQYFVGFSKKYALEKYLKLQHKITEARWLDERGEWKIDVDDLRSGKTFDHTCDIFINAGGYLNNPSFPDIPGLDTYQGKLLHSASWDQDFDVKGKRVALLGNGSSGVQILPAIQPDAEHITFFMRSPTWILPPVGKGQKTYTAAELEEHKDPVKLSTLRKINERVVNSYFSLYMQGSPLQNQCTTEFTRSMLRRLPTHLPASAFVPKWGVGCRRLTSGPGYLESLSASNIDTILGGVCSLTRTGCVDTHDAHHEFDAIICATGFNTSYIPRFPIYGLHALNLQTYWAEKPRSYLGLAADGFPNFFTLLGPYSPIANGPTIPGLEAQVDHVIALIDRFQTENIHSLTPKSAAVCDFLEHHETFMRRSVWMHSCRSSFKQHTSSKLPQIWPGSTLHCREALRDVRGDDWDIVYSKSGNRFSWLGNGISQTEMDPISDLGWYLSDRDQSALGSRGARRRIETRSGEVDVPRRELFKIQR